MDFLSRGMNRGDATNSSSKGFGWIFPFASGMPRASFFSSRMRTHGLTRFDDKDFPASSSIVDTLDIRQFYVEWLRIGGRPLGFKVGRQQISYGDQRVFGPGNWGNTGRLPGTRRC